MMRAISACSYNVFQLHRLLISWPLLRTPWHAVERTVRGAAEHQAVKGDQLNHDNSIARFSIREFLAPKLDLLHRNPRAPSDWCGIRQLLSCLAQPADDLL